MTLRDKLLLGVVILVLAEIVERLWIRFKARRRRGWGFRDVVRDPTFWRRSGDSLEELNRAQEEAKATWDDAKVARATRHFILKAKDTRSAWKEARCLYALASRTHATVLSILADPRNRKRLAKPTGVDILPEAPINRACRLLGTNPPADALPLLVPFLSGQSKHIRTDVVGVVASIGGPEAVPHVLQALADEDEYVRGYALRGLKSALERGALSPESGQELFPRILRLIEEGKNGDDASAVLFRIDPKRATEAFLKPPVFALDSSVLFNALETLAEGGELVPRAALLELIRAAENRELKYPATYNLGRGLIALGRHRLEEDRARLTSFLTHDEDVVAVGAANGLIALHGLDGYAQRVFKPEKESGRDSLSRAQRLFDAAFMLDAEVKNGGFDQYFVNSWGKQWPDALMAFEEMRSVGCLAAIRAAAAKFGPHGPPIDREQRQEQLALLTPDENSIFAEQDNQYDDAREPFAVLACRLVLKYPESFR